MEKQTFLDRVGQTLLANGLSPAAVERQIDKLSRYIDEEAGENAEAMLDEEDPVMLAEEICAILRRNAARRAAAEAVAAVEEEAVAQPQPAAPQITLPPTAEIKIAPEDTAPTREMEIVHPGQTVDFVDLPAQSLGQQPGEDYAVPVFAFDEAEPEPEEKPSHRRQRGARTLEVDPVGSSAVAYAGEPGGPLFWVLFILSLPFAAAIGLAVLALFVVAFAVLAALMVAAIAGLAAVAAAGVAFTLVALINGIVQALSTLPVGLYEIGIGITGGAIVLFVSILLYNFAIRLMPFAMKQLARFFGWTVRHLKLLFIYVKGACAKL